MSRGTAQVRGNDDNVDYGFEARRAQEIEAELESYRAALNRHAIVAATDKGGRITAVNDLFCEISRHSRDELLGQKHSIVNSGYHPREFFVDMWRTIGAGRTWHGDIRNRAKDGTIYWVDTTVVPRRDAEGRIDGYISIRYDITKRKQAEADLIAENHRRERAEHLLRDVLEALPDGVSAFDAEDRLILFNAAFRDAYPVMAPVIAEGADFETLLRYGVNRGQFPQVRDSDGAREAWVAARLHDHRNPGRSFVQQVGGDRWLQVQERHSSSGYTVGVRTDITHLKLAERQIKQQAERDPLTGLFNRRVLLERLQRSLAPRRQGERSGALLLLDLDGFKALNDTLGHDAGDALLVEIAGRLSRSVRKTDLVARLGGDEFALMICNLSSDDDAVRVVEKLQHVLEVPFRLGQRQIQPRGSFGVALYPRDGETPTDLMKHSDIALYHAKSRGRSTYALYDPALRRDVERRAGMTDALRAAMARDQIKVALQPQVNFRTGRHAGFEALVRWQRGRTHVPPPELISVAEESGLIVTLGYLIVEKALMAMREMTAAGLQPGTLAVNVAAAQLRDRQFTRRLCALAQRYAFDPTRLEVEITEGVFLDRNADAIAETLHELHRAGIRVALDDFGTGYASLSHLKQLPIDRLKIDRSFVGDVTAGGEDTIIARTIVSLAHSLGMEVVAEGVETTDQYDFLAAQGCDYAQGYLISRPMLPPEAQQYLSGGAEPSMPLPRTS